MKTKNDDFAYILARFFRFYLPGERGLSENTIASYRDTFKQLLLYCKSAVGLEPEKLELPQFTRELILGFLESIETSGNSISTRNQRLAALKTFFSYIKYEFPEHLEIAKSILDITFKKCPESAVSYLTVDEVTALLNQPDTTSKKGYRDMLLLSILYDSGARVSELTGVRIGDIRCQKPATIILHGKGNKSRIVPLSNKTAALIEGYIEKEKLDKPESKDKLLFTNPQGNQLTRIGVTYILKKYAKKAHDENPSVINVAITPHSIRHSKAMHLLQSGVALIYIRDFLGHSEISTTEIYAKADNASKRKALEDAYSPVTEMCDKPLWNDDPSLMRFLGELCKK